MKFTIRKAVEKDFADILFLIKELADFEKAPEKVTNSVGQMKNEKDHFQCFVAENSEKEIVGFALYFFTYYTWVGKSLYLDDLYVKKQYRGNQIGTELLKKIFEIAKNENCKRVRWQVLNWNKPAIDMYKKSGAEIDNEWSNCDFDPKGIREFGL
ncbi:MAG: GNAT family N-acetyltransferase [Candidatus Marinimicrobia bacterium]|nr:GNAT family N-acetyltransferase [Candidatus Neomarinimicrobiota bacterium]